MDYVMSEHHSFDVLKRYAYFASKQAHIQTNNTEVVSVVSPPLKSVLLGDLDDFITNEKLSPHSSCELSYEPELISNKKTMYGHLVLGDVKGAVFDNSVHYLTDLLNFSFMCMGHDPSLTVAAIQAAFLFDRLHGEDMSVDIGNKKIGGIKPYGI
ncbi:MAG: hypothetical protein WC179_08035 [Candidatus Cloacimonadaceae bacterium]